MFEQTRNGLADEELVVYEFRSMTAQDSGAGVRQTTKNDPPDHPVWRLHPPHVAGRVAPVLQRASGSHEHRRAPAEYKLEYLRDWSLVFDLQIIARTVRLVFFERKAYERSVRRPHA